MENIFNIENIVGIMQVEIQSLTQKNSGALFNVRKYKVVYCFYNGFTFTKTLLFSKNNYSLL